MTELEQLVAEDGNYQDVVINDKTVLPGWRDCQTRFDILKPYLKDNQSFIDIGSHFGYFSMQIAKHFPGSVVWSIEAGERRSNIQKMILQENNIRNVLLSQYTLTQNDLVSLVRSCETFDTILCLSTIHYFPKEQIPQILWLFGQLAANLIIEFPSPDEVDVAEKEVVDSLNDPMRLLGLSFDSVIKIGEATSPKHENIKRSIYLAQNYEIKRGQCVSYLGALTGKKHTVVFKEAKWKIDGKKIKYRGVNLAHLKRFNIQYPEAESLIERAAENYIKLIEEKNGNITDIHPRNVIVTDNDCIPIDYKEGVESNIYGLTWDSYKTLALELDKSSLKALLLDKYTRESIAAVLNYELGEWV